MGRFETSLRRRTTSGHTARAPSPWRATVACVSASQCTLKFGFGFATPFIPLFLHQQLHVQTAASLAFWSGVVAGATGFGSAVTSPLWGAAADRFGRKRMLIRAMAAGALVMALTALVESPLQFAAVRMLLGVTGGTTAAAAAFVAAEAPAPVIIRALGVLTSATAVGQTLGPVGGAFMALQLGLRRAFVLGGALVALPIVPLAVIARETQRPDGRVRVSYRAAMRAITSTRRDAIIAILGVQCLTQFAFIGTQQLTVVKIIGFGPGSATLSTAFGFLILGGCVSISAAAFSMFMARRVSMRALASMSSALMAAFTGLMAEASTLGLLLAALAGVGLTYGFVNACLYAMLGVEAPTSQHGMVFGLNGTAVAIGMTLGPLVTGAVASATTLAIGLLVAAASLVASAGVLSIAAREPIPADHEGDVKAELQRMSAEAIDVHRES